jgi:serine/threonine-protein kinase
MTERADVRAPAGLRTDTGSSASDSGFERLAPDVRSDAYRRLAGVALIYAATYLLLYLVDWAFLFRERWSLCAPDTVDTVRTAAAIAVAIGVFFLARGERIPPRSFLNAALVFEISGAYGIVGGFWGWGENLAEYLRILVDSGADLEHIETQGVQIFGMGSGGSLTWVSVWVLIFPLVVPMPQRRAILAAFLTTSVLPVVILLSHAIQGVPPIVRPHVPYLYFSTLIPAYVVAAIAAVGCAVTYNLSRDLSRERELGAYRLVEKIGQGGMGEVWRARHRMLVRPAAVKLIRPEALGGGDGGRGELERTAIRRFKREAQATAGLCSPHTVELYDFGVADDGTFYYVMELLDGIDLKTLVERYGPQPASRVVHILEQAAHSLADAHATGLVHRDVKPGNLFVCRRGLDHDFVKVLDFGLVKETGHAREGGGQLTAEGVTSGTPGFMAPEMAVGQMDVDGRADLYALGCLAYWLLTGKLVFEGENAMSVLLQHAKDPPVPPSKRTEIEIPASLEGLVMELLAKRPEDRPDTAHELARRLHGLRDEIGPWTAERARRWWDTHHPERPTMPDDAAAIVSAATVTRARI